MVAVRSFFMWLAVTALLVSMPGAAACKTAFSVTVTDSTGQAVRFAAPPRRVVCLVPYVTEMVLAFGREEVLAGVTRQDLTLKSALRIKSVGSYFTPDAAAVEACRPDLIIAAPSQADLARRLGGDRCKVVILAVGRLEDAFDQMALIGRVLDCEDQAAAVIQRNREQLALVKARLKDLPRDRRKRVARVMAGEALSCPGDDSFQNEMIVAAGGIPPHWGQDGFAVPADPAAWQRFDPQVIYGCHDNEAAVRELLARPGWREVTAVRTGAVTMFPCDLTCHASTRVGAFVQWLAAVLYLETFADPQTAVQPDRVLSRTPVVVDLPYVDRARVVEHRVADAPYKSVEVRFKRPQAVLSTLEGSLAAVRAVGNTYVPMHASLSHMAHGITQVQAAIAKNLGYAPSEYAGLMTGAHMDHLAVRTETWKDLQVTALVTAGVKGNAMRMSGDAATWYKPGTINILLMTNRRLPPAAMALAIITATEAKTAALLDMDIRSSYTPLAFRATGTGTDNIIVVQGEGPEEIFTGGHTKMGELIARAVHAGVTEAVFKQNGLRADRGPVQRLADRRLSLDAIAARFPVKMAAPVLAARLEATLSIPFYGSFLEAALTLSDDYRKGLIKDLAFFDAMCATVTARLSGRADLEPMDVSAVKLPEVLARAMGALVNGIVHQPQGPPDGDVERISPEAKEGR